MSAYSKFILTNAGNALLSDILNGDGVLEFRCLATGSGEYTTEDASTDSIREMESLKQERQQTAFSYIGRIEGGLVELKADVANNGLEEGYYLTEAGIYAGKVGEEESVLYCVSIATEADYMPDYQEGIPYNVIFDVQIGIGDVDKITINFQPDAYALAEDLQNHISDTSNPHQVDKAQVGLKNVDNTSDMDKPVSTAQQEAIDAAYQQAAAYADTAIADLINGAPSTLDTLGEIAEAMAENASVVEALDAAIGTKAKQTDLDEHTGNTTIHITASERESWNAKLDTDGDSSNTTVAFEQADTRTAISTGEKLSVLFGKIKKWLTDLKAVAYSGSYNDLSDQPSIPTKTSELTNDSGYKTTDTNTTYALSKSGSTITLTGSDGSTTSVTDSNDNTVYTHPSYTARTGVPTANQTPAFGGTFSVTQPVSDSTGHITAMNSRTVTIPSAVATTSAAGLMSAADKETINNLSSNYAAKSHTHDYLPLSGGTLTGDLYMKTNPIYFNTGYIKSDANQSVYFAASDETNYRMFYGVRSSSWTFCPAVDDMLTLGQASYRWAQIYSSVATISTSDRNQKKDINALSDKYLALFALLQPVSFLFINGTSGRTHVGFISQDVEEAMKQVGLSDLEFAGFCKDIKYTTDPDTGEESQVLDEDGNPVYIYSLRYEEFIALNTAVIQAQQKQISALDGRLEKLEEIVESLSNQ